MKIQKKFLFGVAGMLLAAGTVNAQVKPVDQMPAPVLDPALETEGTSDEAVLFKIHDVAPVKNAETNLVVSCNFYITFYNRSPRDMNGAELSLTWKDDALSDVIGDEKNDSTDKFKNDGIGAPDYSFTQQDNPQRISTGISMPAVKSFQQTTIRSSIRTDRCFALLNDLSVNVQSCASKGNNAQVIGGSSNSNCNGLFRYISQESPEYYMDFKPISYADQKIGERKKQVLQERDVEDQYRKAVVSFDALTQTLAEIK